MVILRNQRPWLRVTTANNPVGAFRGCFRQQLYFTMEPHPSFPLQRTSQGGPKASQNALTAYSVQHSKTWVLERLFIGSHTHISPGLYPVSRMCPLRLPFSQRPFPGLVRLRPFGERTLVSVWLWECGSPDCGVLDRRL
jgi:hypothetical protein